jgi:hypothetical protein
MSKTTPIPGFVPAAPLSSPAGLSEPATSPARGPSAAPGAGAAITARSSLTTGTAGRAAPPSFTAPSASFGMARQNAVGPQTPNQEGAGFMAGNDQSPFKDQNGVAGFAQQLHSGSQAWPKLS